MTATGHALIGLALATQIPNPYIGIPVAIISHAAADAFPHWDTGTNMYKNSRLKFVVGSFVDLFLSFIIPFTVWFIFFKNTNPIYVFFMIIAAQSFDWGAAPHNFLKKDFFPVNLFQRAQELFDHQLDKPWGIILQVIMIALVFAVALIF